MSQDFTRGSQITFHYLRMFTQSLKRIAFSCIGIFITAMLYYLYDNVDHYVLRVSLFFKYFAALIYQATNVNQFIVFQDYHGSMNKVSATNYATWYSQSIVPSLELAVKSSVIFALKASTAFFLTVSATFYIRGAKQNSKKHLRGMRLISGSKLKRQIKLHNFLKGEFKPYKIGNISYPKDSYFQHTLVTGSSGTGKTQAMLELMDSIRARGDKAIIYDRTGSYVRKFYQEGKDVILNPFDKRSVPWNLFNEGKQRTDLDLMAASLIAQSKGDPFWSSSARLVFSETCESFLRSGKTNMKDLIDILLKIPLEEFNKYLKDSDSFATSVIDPKSKGTAQSIRSVLTSYVNCLKFTLDNQGDFSVRDWIQNDNIDNFLFLSSSADKQQTLKPLTTLWLDIAINNILTLDQEVPRKIWVIIDELPSLQYLPSLDTGISEARQFGGCFVVSTQSMARLKEVYGNNMTESLSVNCKNRLVFGAPNQETATWCARDFGNSETMSNKDNISFGANEIRDVVSSSQNKELVNLVLPSQIMNLENLEFYVKMGSFDAAKSKLKYKKRPDIAPKIMQRDNLIITDDSIKKYDKKEEQKQKESKKNDKAKKGSKAKTSTKSTKKSKSAKSNDLSQDEDFVSNQYWEGIAENNALQTNDIDSKKETSIAIGDNNQEENQDEDQSIMVDEVDEDGVVTKKHKDQKESLIKF